MVPIARANNHASTPPSFFLANLCDMTITHINPKNWGSLKLMLSTEKIELDNQSGKNLNGGWPLGYPPNLHMSERQTMNAADNIITLTMKLLFLKA
jgi:hypothetical protein